MIYPICPTCGALLSNVQLPYCKELLELSEKYDVDLELLSRGIVEIEEFNKEKENLINKYTDPQMYCCKMRLSNFVEIVKLIR